MIDLVCVDGLLFLKDDVLDADPGRSRGFEGKATFYNQSRCTYSLLCDAPFVRPRHLVDASAPFFLALPPCVRPVCGLPPLPGGG